MKWPVQIEGTGCQGKGDGLDSGDGPRMSLSSQTSSLKALVRVTPGGAECSETSRRACSVAGEKQAREKQARDGCIRSVEGLV